MADSVLLGIDVGTSGTKLTLIDPAGGILGEVGEPAGYSSPRPGWAEADPEGWWRNVCLGVPRLLAKTGCRAERVAAVGVSGMVPTVVLLDRDGRVVRPSIQQNDARAVDEISYLQARTQADEVLQRTGSPISQQSVGPKVLWLRRHEPESLARTARLCGSYDLIVHRLTGEWSLERNWALESGLYDFRDGRWDAAMLDLATIRPEWLPSVRRPADVVGAVTVPASAETGLPAGIPVVAGSADHVASAFSAGIVEPGDILVKLGSAGDILYCADRPLVDQRLFLDYHLLDGRYLVNGCMAASGSLIAWFRDTLAPGVPLGELDAEAATTPPGADGCILLPYFLGEKTPIFDPLARGTIVGLTLSHSRGHLFRAVLEGIGFAFRHHLEVIGEIGPLPARARCTNGGSRSRLWKQITADVLGLPLEAIAAHPGSSLGAAFAAGMGAGLFSDWSQIRQYLRISSTTMPDRAGHERYTALYPVYRQVYDRLQDVYPRLSAASEP